MPVFEYKDHEAIGKVFSVDTASVVLQVDDGEKLRSLKVNHLVAIRSAKVGQHLIGMIRKIMRRSISGPPDLIEEDLPEGLAIVENVVHVLLIGTFLDAHGLTQNVFKRTLESVPEIDADGFLIEGRRLTNFMHAVSDHAKAGKTSLSLGKYALDEDAEAFLDGNKFFQRHAVIVGSTGSGKSWTVARLLEQVAALQNPNAVVFDIHGEYAPLKGPEIQHLKVAGPGNLEGQQDLEQGVIFLPYWLLNYEEIVALLLDRSDQNAPNQAMIFNREVIKAKRAALESNGPPELLGQFTVDSPIPYDLDTVIDALKDIDTEKVPGANNKPKNGPFHGKLTRFIQRLEAKKADRRLGFLFQPPPASMEHNWMVRFCEKLLCGGNQQAAGGVKIIDFSEVPSDILPLVLGLVSRLMFTVQQWTEKEKLHPISIFCDEAHLYIPERLSSNALLELGYRSFERIAKEGRKYGTGLVVISQRPSEVNRTVLSQCNNYVAMRLTNAEDQASIRRLLPDSLGGIPDSLPILDLGEALVVGDASLLPARVKVTPPQQKPASATVPFWDEWSDAGQSSGIADAVVALRQQARDS